MLRDAIADGTIGTLQAFSIHRQSKGLIREGQATWRNGPGGVCGQAIESLSHDLDVLRFCAGDVKAVQAYTRATLPFAPRYDNLAVASMELACGAVASLHADWNAAPAFNLRGATGSRGGITLSGPGNWELRELRLRTDSMAYDEIRVINDTLDATCYAREYGVFLGAIRGECEAIPSGLDGLRVLEISLAILRSSESGKAIYL
ncbi:hypothetical protein LJC74_02090 [Eubacteriales bacterium OttesenSCG-928-A19]|nr:hypothetical protein [Eubacteriales bacterium OttesenSCG-928-A19]